MCLLFILTELPALAHFCL